MTEQKNIFEQMKETQEELKSDATTPNVIDNVSSEPRGSEITVENLSDISFSEKKKYQRPNYEGKVVEDKVDNFQIFSPDLSKLPHDSKFKTSKYWSISQKITYASKNKDDINNREFISGAICFQQEDGTPSEPLFWYEGCRHQSGMIWELVAKALNIPPNELSSKKYKAFLDMSPVVLVEGKEYDNYGAKKGESRTVIKNMPKEFKI